MVEEAAVVVLEAVAVEEAAVVVLGATVVVVVTVATACWVSAVFSELPHAARPIAIRPARATPGIRMSRFSGKERPDPLSGRVLASRPSPGPRR